MKITQIPWIEIPVNDFDNAVVFYGKVLGLIFNHQSFEGRRHAISKLNEHLSISLVESKEIICQGPGPVLFFKVESDMGLVLERVESFGGKIIQPKSLIRNTNKDGATIIAKTMIDHKSGYYALFCDSENHLLALYSNS
jgi:predicted enzyme related to lactoylglutathione lyase